MDENQSSRAADISEWSNGAHERAAGIAEMFGVTMEDYTENPLSLLPNLQNYVDRLPFNEFEQSDWVTLHTDLSAYLGDLMTIHHGAKWTKVSDPTSPAGYRFLVESRGLNGAVHHIEPFDIVMEEFEHPPIEIGRMIANAEAVLQVTPTFQEGERNRE